MMRRAPLAAIALLALSPPAASQTQTVGLFQNDPGAHAGYTLFSPMAYTNTYLIDINGELVHEWATPYVPGAMGYLLPNGDLLRTARAPTPTPFNAGGFGGLIQQWDWDGNLVWEFPCSDSTKGSHHDVEALPNGNVLVIAWVRKTSGEAIQAGRDPLFLTDGELWSDMIFELEPDGAGGATVVWEWDAWDHLIQDFDASADNFGVVADRPELIDINYWENTGADWLHINSVDYNPDLDQIALSVPKFDEFWIIDHSTTTSEAAGHTGGDRNMGGDLLYRWGNPAAHGAGTTSDQLLWYQHDVHWITPGLPGEGRILLFNNGRNRPEGNFSTVEEIVTTVDSLGNYPQPPSGTPHGPATQAWIYPAVFDSTLFSRGISGAERMPNGNTLICEGADGRIFEIDNSETKYWEYIVPVDANGPIYQYWQPGQNRSFRAPAWPRPHSGSPRARPQLPGPGRRW